jgi:hypothetical protein
VKRSNPYSYSKAAYYESLVECLGDAFTEDGVPEKQTVVDIIRNDKWEKVSPDQFRMSLSNSKYKEMLTDYSPSELSQMKLFKVPGFDIGFALKKHGDEPFSEIVAVHNNSPIKGIGDELIQSAVRNGGKYLDHFEGELDKFYSRNGFVEYKRDNYNPDYDEGGKFKQKFGPLDVVYRVYKGG